jgi:hypothetical protein
MAGTLQRGVQQPDSQLIPLADDQRKQRRKPGGRLRAGRQAGHECRLDFVHGGRGWLSMQKLLLRADDPGHGLEIRAAPGQITEPPQPSGEARPQLRDGGRDDQQRRAELKRALGIGRPQLPGQRRNRAGHCLRRAAAGHDRAPC